jgi:hypothetical protein
MLVQGGRGLTMPPYPVIAYSPLFPLLTISEMGSQTRYFLGNGIPNHELGARLRRVGWQREVPLMRQCDR